MEYYTEPLFGVQKTLSGISAFIKGKISIDTLLEYYRYVINDTERKNIESIFSYEWNSEGLIK